MHGRHPGKAFQKMFAPVFRQSGRGDCFVQQRAIVSIGRNETVHLFDGESLRGPAQKLKRVAGSYRTLFFHREVDSAASADKEAFQHVISLELSRQFVAGSARLPHHYDCGPDLQAVSNMKIPFAQILRREILPKHSPRKIGAGQLVPPERIML